MKFIEAPFNEGAFFTLIRKNCTSKVKHRYILLLLLFGVQAFAKKDSLAYREDQFYLDINLRFKAMTK